MAIYFVSDSWHGGLDAGYTIERISPGEAPMRLRFKGTKAEAQAEADRLNLLSRARTGWRGPRGNASPGTRIGGRPAQAPRSPAGEVQSSGADDR